MSAQHTPTPWAVYDAGEDNYPGIDAGWRTIVMFGSSDEDCGIRGDTPEEAEANARFIVRAVNCHDELLAALEGDIDWIDALSQMTIERDTAMVRIRAHRALIAKARGEVA